MSQFGPDSSLPQPPVSADFNVPVEPPSWPKVVGIISIVMASLSLVCGACGIIQNGMSLASGGKDLPMANGNTMHLPAPSALSVVAQGAGWLWAILLLVAGIMTLKRVANGRMLHIVYAAVSIVLGIAGTALAMGDVARMTEALNQDPQMAQMAGIMKPAMYGGMCIGVALALGYPVFLLVWFGAMGKRPEAGKLPEEPLV
jgi:hypothetical protein